MSKKKDAEKKFGHSLSKLLMSGGPAFIKLGQVLSTRSDLIGEEISNELSNLQNNIPQHKFSEILPEIEKQFQGKVGELFQKIEQKAIAAASIAQVHKAITKDGNQVAIKILRPNIEKKFEQNLSLLGFVASIVTFLASATKRLKLTEVVNTVKKISIMELDLCLEAAASDKLRHICKNDVGIKIPKIYWQYTGKRILVTEWIDGISIHNTKKLKEKGFDLKVIFSNLAISFFNQAFNNGFFHADLHPGNIFVDQEGNVVLVDFGIAEHLEDKYRMFVAEMIWCFVKKDYDRIAKFHFEMGIVPDSQSVQMFSLVCRSIGKQFVGKSVSQVSTSSLLKQLFQILNQFQMQTQPQLMLLQKTIIMLEGLGHSLCPEINMWMLISPWIKKWTKNNIGIKAKTLNFGKNTYNSANKFTSLLTNSELVLKKLANIEFQRKKESGKAKMLTAGFILGSVTTSLIIYYII